MAKKDDEFFSDWHRDQHIKDIGREIAAAEARLEQLGEMKDTEAAVSECKSIISAAKAELKRLGGSVENLAPAASRAKKDE